MSECNFFSIFNVDETFLLTNELLESKYLDLQQKYHPDRLPVDKVVNISDAAMSSNVNMAYLALKNPIERAYHLCKIWLNFDIKKDDANIEMNFEILQEILEINEKISNLDSKVKGELDGKIDQILESFNVLLLNKANATQNKDLIINKITRLRFLARSLESL